MRTRPSGSSTHGDAQRAEANSSRCGNDFERLVLAKSPHRARRPREDETPALDPRIDLPSRSPHPAMKERRHEATSEVEPRRRLPVESRHAKAKILKFRTLIARKMRTAISAPAFASAQQPPPPGCGGLVHPDELRISVCPKIRRLRYDNTG